MKTLRSLLPSHRRGRGDGLPDRIGAQVAAVLLAVLVTPSTLPALDGHADATAALDHGAPRPPGR